MGTEAKIVLWWVLFGGTHIVGSMVPIRTALIDRLSLRGFKAVYSLVSLATFVPLCYVYLTDKHAGTLLFVPPELAHSISVPLMFLAFIVLVYGELTPSAIGTAAEMMGRFRPEPRGIQRITRHPVNTSFALFGLAHMVSNPASSDWLFFGGFVVYSVLSALHQDARMRAHERAAVREYVEATSMVPFAAIVTGRQRFVLGEMKPLPLVIGVGIAVTLWKLHGSIFGGFVG